MFLCVCVLLLHQTLQFVLLSCLTLVALSGVPFGVALDAAALDASAPVFPFAVAMTVLFGLVVPISAFLFAVRYASTWPLLRVACLQLGPD